MVVIFIEAVILLTIALSTLISRWENKKTFVLNAYFIAK